MNDDNNLDLLDLDDDSGSMDTLPDAVPFGAPRPKKPWLLFGKRSGVKQALIRMLTICLPVLIRKSGTRDKLC